MIKKGDRFIVTRGEYDDYEICGSFEAIADFDPEIVSFPLRIKEVRCNPHEFSVDADSLIKLLLENGMIRRLPLLEVYVGSTRNYDGDNRVTHTDWVEP